MILKFSNQAFFKLNNSFCFHKMRIRLYNLIEPLEPGLDVSLLNWLRRKYLIFFCIIMSMSVLLEDLFLQGWKMWICVFFYYGLHFCCDSLPPWQIRNISASTFSINIGLLRNISHRTLMGLSHVVSGLDCLSTGVMLKKQPWGELALTAWAKTVKFGHGCALAFLIFLIRPAHL